MLVHETSTEAEKQEFFSLHPTTLCKYRIWTDKFHKRVISDNELYFSSPKKFNDPYDCGLPFKQHPHNSDPLIIKQVVERSARNNFPELINNEIALEEKCAKQVLLIQQNPENWFEMNWHLKPENINEIFGVLSLTPHHSNYLMWSHYSDCHRGFCVEFDTRLLIESIAGHFQKVSYEKDIPYISITDAMEGELLEKLIYTKSEIWKYEDEFRLSRIYKADFTANYNPAALKAIYFGYKMPPEQQIEIIEVLSNQKRNVEFYKMELDKTEFKLVPGKLALL